MKFNIQQNIAARGYYSLKVLDAHGDDTGKKVQDIPNVVTNYGRCLTRHDSNGPVAESIAEGLFEFAAGTGTTERTATSTSLGAELAVARGSTQHGDGTGFVDNGDGTETYKKVSVGSYPLGAVDETISEVGVFHNTTLAAGQLIKDGNGDPTTITVLPDEQLVVTYTIEWTYSKDSIPETTGTVDVNGTTITWTLQVSPVRAGGLWKYPERGTADFGVIGKGTLLDGGEASLFEGDLGTQTFTETTGQTNYTVGKAFAPSEGMGDVASIILGTISGEYSVLQKYCYARLDLSPAITKTDAELLDVEISWDLSAV